MTFNDKVLHNIFRKEKFLPKFTNYMYESIAHKFANSINFQEAPLSFSRLRKLSFTDIAISKKWEKKENSVKGSEILFYIISAKNFRFRLRDSAKSANDKFFFSVSFSFLSRASSFEAPALFKFTHICFAFSAVFSQKWKKSFSVEGNTNASSVKSLESFWKECAPGELSFSFWPSHIFHKQVCVFLGRLYGASTIIVFVYLYDLNNTRLATIARFIYIWDAQARYIHTINGD